MKPLRISAVTVGACSVMVSCTLESNLASLYGDSSVDAGASAAQVDGSDSATNTSTVDASSDADDADGVDILFMIDNSGSMAEEQARITIKLESLVAALSSGDLEFGKTGPRTDNYPGRYFSPPKSLHVGFVTSDLGAPPGVLSPASPDCTPDNGGAKGSGLLQYSGAEAANPQLNPYTRIVYKDAVPACATVSLDPPYFDFHADDSGAPYSRAFSDALFDVSCVSTVGVYGCGIEQQLESIWKALAPQSIGDFVGPDTRGQGDRGNAGFLRETSVLAVVVVTDEDDCSVTSEGTLMFEKEAPNGVPPVQVRCQLLRDDPEYVAKVQRTSRYVDGLLSLRPQHPERLVFAGIVGLPQVDVDYTQFDSLLDDPRMQNRLDPEAPTPYLATACGSEPTVDAPSQGTAYPGRSFVEVAKGIAEAGGNALLSSVCDDDYTGVLNRLVRTIAAQLGTAASTSASP